jgi:hypothetical protein
VPFSTHSKFKVDKTPEKIRNKGGKKHEELYSSIQFEKGASLMADPAYIL